MIQKDKNRRKKTLVRRGKSQPGDADMDVGSKVMFVAASRLAFSVKKLRRQKQKKRQTF
jgi:hypothetical protein